MSALASTLLALGLGGGVLADAQAPAPAPVFGALEAPAIIAQTGERATPPLTLDEVLESVDRHPRIDAARRGVDAADGAALAARGHFDLRWRGGGYLRPVSYYVHGRLDTQIEQATPLWGVRLIAGYGLGRGTIPTYYGERETLSAGEVRAGLVVPLWRDGPIDRGRAGIRRAALDREIALLDRDRETIALIKDATQRYWEWVAAGLRRAVADEQLELANARSDQLHARASRGEIPPVDATDNDRARLRREATAIKARQELRQAAISLRLHLRDREGEPLEIDESRLPATIPLDERVLPGELRAMIDEALARRPDLHVLVAQRAQYLLDRRLARNQRAPAIDVGAMVLRDFGRGPASLAPTELQVSLAVDVPIQARQARGKLREAEAKAAVTAAKARLLRDTIAAEVERALVAVLATHEQAMVAGEAVEVARALAEAERRRFDLGDTTLLFVNLREQQVAEAALAEIDARLAYQRALAELEATTASSLGDGPEPAP